MAGETSKCWPSKVCGAMDINADADRISYEFLSMVAENFRRDGNIVEKYNVVSRSSDAHAENGYTMNVVGFGWTNAAFLEILHGLPKETADRLAASRIVHCRPRPQ